MKNIIGLLHDTYLQKVQLINTEILLSFSFFLTDNKEYTVNLISKNISDISCNEISINNTNKEVDLYNIKGSDCLKAEQNLENIEMLLENIEKNTIIKLKYKSKISSINGNVAELKQFWA